MKLGHVRTIFLSCIVGFENNLVQTIMTKQFVMNKNHVIRSIKGLCHGLHLNFVHRFQCLYLFIT